MTITHPVLFFAILFFIAGGLFNAVMIRPQGNDWFDWSPLVHCLNFFGVVLCIAIALAIQGFVGW
jgi:hypothetical protein